MIPGKPLETANGRWLVPAPPVAVADRYGRAPSRSRRRIAVGAVVIVVAAALGWFAWAAWSGRASATGTDVGFVVVDDAHGAGDLRRDQAQEPQRDLHDPGAGLRLLGRRAPCGCRCGRPTATSYARPRRCAPRTGPRPDGSTPARSSPLIARGGALPWTIPRKDIGAPVSNTTENVRWLTQEQFDKLKGELDHLAGPGRADLAKKIEAAREEGDLRENGGYHAAKEEQGKQEARIRQLTALLETRHRRRGAERHRRRRARHGRHGRAGRRRR